MDVSGNLLANLSIICLLVGLLLLHFGLPGVADADAVAAGAEGPDDLVGLMLPDVPVWEKYEK